VTRRVFRCGCSYLLAPIRPEINRLRWSSIHASPLDDRCWPDVRYRPLCWRIDSKRGIRYPNLQRTTTPRRNTSRKRSAASSNAKPLEAVAFYLDESIYSRALCEALEEAGAVVRRPGVDIPFGTPDATWLSTAGAQVWIVLMQDQRVRQRALEVNALRAARVGTFVLTAG
jgi:hypothetical protein